MSDPDALLAYIRDYVRADARFPLDSSEAGQLVEHIAELDKSLTEGGYLPAAWGTSKSSAALIEQHEQTISDLRAKLKEAAYESARVTLLSAAKTVRHFGPLVKWDAEGVEMFLKDCLETLDPKKMVGGDG